ncbi:MAG: AMP-binding protein [Planctomycetota bacterium]
MPSLSTHRNTTERQDVFDRFGSTLPRSLAELLRRRAWDFGDLTAFCFLREDGTRVALSFLELDCRARALAQRLRRQVDPGQRVLLMFPPGLEFIEAFFGCMYAGVLAVPMSPPKRRDRSSRVSTIVGDCKATLGLTNSWGSDLLLGGRQSGVLERVQWISVDTIDSADADDWEPPDVAPDDCAFIQYTSGSTDRPRGVVVSHGNLVHNLELIHSGFGLRRGTPNSPAGVGVSWLPAYHDMGLIGGILESLWAGGMSVLMAPSMFLQRPERWLRTISDYGACVSGGPNFAYDLCVRKIGKASLESLDLSTWQVAFCGAEPIRAETVERFIEKFAPCGFREDAFYPCYGLAEATLFVTGGEGARAPLIRRFRRSRLQSDGLAEPARGNHGDTRQLVGCGRTLLDQTLAIVNPLTKTSCPDGTVGEIWVRGPSVSGGYWPEDRLSDDFNASLADTGEGGFLRTGDLGFLQGGELFVTGRLKELVIIRGRNLDPADIESTAQMAHPALLPDSGAAFSREMEGEERLVVINELDRSFRNTDYGEVFRAVRRKITQEHGVEPYALALLRPMSLPRTTSGKVRRESASEGYAKGELKVVAEWSKEDSARTTTSAPLPDRPRATATSPQADRLAREIERRILKWLRDHAGVPSGELDRDRPFAEHGIDSMAAIELSSELENWLNIKLSPMTAWQYPTPAAISRYLAVESMASEHQSPAPDESQGAPEETGLEQLLETLDNLSENDVTELLDEGKTSDDTV